jgi:hypothetical protein
MRCLVRDTREDAVRTFPTCPHSGRDDADAWLAKNHIDYTITPTMKEAFRNANAAIRTVYPEVIHIMDGEVAVEICQVIPYELQEAMGDRMAVLGSPEYITAKMKERTAGLPQHLPTPLLDVPVPGTGTAGVQERHRSRLRT